MAQVCRYLSKDSASFYNCSIRKKKCSYQRYCTITKQYYTDKCTQCPMFKPKTDDK